MGIVPGAAALRQTLSGYLAKCAIVWGEGIDVYFVA